MATPEETKVVTDMTSVFCDAEYDQAGWQVGKSVLEVNKYMLQTQLRCDVTFRLHTDKDDVTKEVGAHTYVLASRSPVFEVMLSDRWKGKDDVINIDDVSSDVFEEFLKYVYYEQCSVDAKNVLPLLYTARKYLISPLVALCSDFVEISMTSENVCTIYQRALTFGAPDLRDRCWTYIYSHANSVLKGDDVTNLGEEALLKIVSSDWLFCDGEDVVYKACIRWGRARCLAHKVAEKATTESRTESKRGPLVNDGDIRTALGPVLQEVRLPTLGTRALGELLGDTDVVTDAEKGALYTYTVTGKGRHRQLYPTSTRIYSPCRVNRFINMNSAKSTSTVSQAKIDAIKVVVDKDVILFGVSVKASIAMSIPSGTLKVIGPETEMVSQRVRAAKGAPSYDVMMIPTLLLADKEYKVCVDWSVDGAKHLNYQFTVNYLGSNRVESEGVAFTITNSDEINSATTTTFGQFQNLLFVPASNISSA